MRQEEVFRGFHDNIVELEDMWRDSPENLSYRYVFYLFKEERVRLKEIIQ